MSDDTMHLTALLLVDASGNVTDTIESLQERLDIFTIRHLIDIDGDDIDEVHVSSEYYEGLYEHIVRWDGATPVVVTIGGDGA
jgi:hypothetical protein